MPTTPVSGLPFTSVATFENWINEGTWAVAGLLLEV